MRRLISLGWLLGLLAGPASAIATARPPSAGGLLSSRWLWATIDVCTATGAGDVVGIRGSMPGTGNAHERMYMLFRLKYRSSTGAWRFVGKAGDSGSVYAGTSAYVSRQAGRDFQLSASTAPGTELRAEVSFDWRLGHQIAHRAQLTTTAGHLVNAGASPHGFSASRCTIS